jgi:hypothetical protein
MAYRGFEKRTVATLANDVGLHPYNLLLSIGDFDGDGRADILVGPRAGAMTWFRNSGDGLSFEPSVVDVIEHTDVGGAVFDIDGDGRQDIVAGGDYLAFALYWWKNPGIPGARWSRHLIVDTGKKQFHDQIGGIVGARSRPSVFFWNQGGRALYEAPIPADPEKGPWPEILPVATDIKEEGLVIADIDGDGENELVAGTRWYKRTATGWEANIFASDYIATRVAVADLDGDGELEILLSEGDACLYGKPQGGKLSWFKRGPDIRAMWRETVIEDCLLDPHSLACGDICGNGHIDIFTGEIGLPDGSGRAPRLLVYENDGTCGFARHVVDEGTGTHQATLADLRGKGVLDIVGKPLHGAEKWGVQVWYNKLLPLA